MLRLVLQEVGVPRAAADWLRVTPVSAGIGGHRCPPVCVCVHLVPPLLSLSRPPSLRCLFLRHTLLHPAGQTAAVCIAVRYCKIVFLAPGSGLSVWLSRRRVLVRNKQASRTHTHTHRPTRHTHTHTEFGLPQRPFPAHLPRPALDAASPVAVRCYLLLLNRHP